MLSLGVRSMTGFNVWTTSFLDPDPNAKPPLSLLLSFSNRMGWEWDGIEGKPTNHQGSLEYPNNRPCGCIVH
jgi:hypothetical protein